MKPLLLCAALCGFALTARAAAPLEIEYARPGGESLKLDAYLPDGPGPFPAVILIHGGGWNTGDKSGGHLRALIAPMEDPLTRAGFAWFSINYRLAPHPFPECLEDVQTAVRWVKAHAAEYRLDPAKIAISGESAGGHLAALAAMQSDPSTAVAAAVIFYGPLDLLAKVRKTDGRLENGLAGLFGRATLDDATAARLMAASPVNYIRPGQPPFLLVHGTADQKVPFGDDLDFQTKLRAAGDTCDLIAIPGGQHGMFYWDKIDPNYREKVVAWLQKTLALPGH
jgi:acetyl esterase/lipase